MEDSITLDRKAFRALSSDSRVAVLKSLARRRKMLVELSRELGMSPSTLSGHMDSLVTAGLVAKIDDGHKWKYYELTRAGRNVVTPGETRIWVIIGIAAFALLFAGYGFADSMNPYFSPAMFELKGAAFQATGSPADANAAAPDSISIPTIEVSSNIGVYAAGFIVFALILGIGIGYVACKRRMFSCQMTT
jgi:DNA-binding transcriptional ArsR family regulator